VEAIAKKNVPVHVVTDQTRATYLLKSAPIEVKTESTGGKIARCLFAYYAGIEDKGNVVVQLIEASSSKMLWAYSVNKQRGGSKSNQWQNRLPSISKNLSSTNTFPLKIGLAATPQPHSDFFDHGGFQLDGALCYGYWPVVLLPSTVKRIILISLVVCET